MSLFGYPLWQWLLAIEVGISIPLILVWAFGGNPRR